MNRANLTKPATIKARYEVPGEEEFYKNTVSIFKKRYGAQVTPAALIIIQTAVRNYFDIIETKKYQNDPNVHLSTSASNIRKQTEAIINVFLKAVDGIKFLKQNPTIYEAIMSSSSVAEHNQKREHIQNADEGLKFILDMLLSIRQRIPNRFSENLSEDATLIRALAVAYEETTGTPPTIKHLDKRDIGEDIYSGDFYELIVEIFQKNGLPPMSGRHIQRLLHKT